MSANSTIHDLIIVWTSDDNYFILTRLKTVHSKQGSRVRNIFLLLILALFANIAEAQIRLMVPKAELPQGWATWQGKSNTIVIREGLVFEMEERGIEDKGLVVTYKINFDLVHALVLELKETEIMATLYWLSGEGYIKLSNKDKKTDAELEKQSDEAWKTWEQYVRKRYKINDEEIKKIKEFLL